MARKLLSVSLFCPNVRLEGDRMKINRYTAEDYEAYVGRCVDQTSRRVVFVPRTIPGLQPIIFDGPIPERARQLNFFFPQEHQIPEIRVDVFRNVHIAGSGIIFTDDGCTLHGHVPVGGGSSQLYHPAMELRLEPVAENGYCCPALQNVTELDHAALIARAAVWNYHHMIVDVFPRLHLLNGAAFRELAQENSVDPTRCQVIVNSGFGWVRDRLAQTGFDVNRLVEIPAAGCLRVRKLFVPHIFSSYANWASPEINNYYRGVTSHMGISGRASTGEKIFCLRRDLHSDRRRFHNVDEIADMLISEGFREISPETMSWAEQIAAFANAKYIVGAHGASLSNVVFCQPGARMLEIHQNDSRFAVHVGMCAAGGQGIGCIWAESFSNDLRGQDVESYVDPALMREGLERLREQP